MNIEKRENVFWLLLDNHQALLLFVESNIELCTLHDDNSESVIETRQDLERLFLNEETVAVYLGETIS